MEQYGYSHSRNMGDLMNSWGKHGGVIRYANVAGLETANSLLREDAVIGLSFPLPVLRTSGGLVGTCAKNGIGGANGHTYCARAAPSLVAPSILKSRLPRPDIGTGSERIVSEKPEVGWQQALDGTKLMWSDYFCMRVGEDAEEQEQDGDEERGEEEEKEDREEVTEADAPCRVGDDVTSQCGGTLMIQKPSLGQFEVGAAWGRAETLPGLVTEREPTVAPSGPDVTSQDSWRNRKRGKRTVHFSTSDKVHEYQPARILSESESEPEV